MRASRFSQSAYRYARSQVLMTDGWPLRERRSACGGDQGLVFGRERGTQ